MKELNFENILSFSFLGWLRKESIKYLLFIYLVIAAAIFSIYLLAVSFIPSILQQQLIDIIVPLLFSPFAKNLSLFIILTIIVVIIAYIVFSYISILITFYAFRLKNITYGKLTFVRFFCYLFILPIVYLLYALLYPQNKKLFIAQICLLLAAIITLFLLPLLAIVFAVLYLIFVFYNCVRYFVVTPIYIKGDNSLFNSFNIAWKLTNKRFFEVFVSLIAVIIISIIIGFIVGLLLYAILSFFTYAPDFFKIPNIISIIADLIFVPFYILIDTFFVVELYSQLIAAEKTTE